jgi:hypothetical protein
MLTITDDAMTICNATISQLSDAQSQSKCLRLVKGADTGLAVTFDIPRKSDELISYEGRAILAVPEKYVDFCSDKTLDLNEDGKLYLS